MVIVNKKCEVSKLPGLAYQIMDINLHKASHCEGSGIAVTSSFQTAHAEKFIRFVFGLTFLWLL